MNKRLGIHFKYWRNMIDICGSRTFRGHLWVASFFLSAIVARIASAQDASLLEHVPGDAVAVLSVYPKDIAALTEFELFPREVVTAAALKEWNIDPFEAEKALVVIGKFTDEEPPPMFMVLRFPTAPAAKKVFSGQRVSAKPEKLGAKDLFHTSVEIDLLMLDEKTVAIGPPKAIVWMATATEGAAAKPFLDLLKKGPKKHLSFAAHLEPVRPIVAKAFTELPPPLDELTSAVKLTRFAEMHIDLSLAGEWGATLHAFNEKDAAALKAVVDKQIDFAAKVVRGQLPQAAASQDPVQQAWGGYLGRATQKILELTTPKVSGGELSLSLKNDRTLTAVVGVLASTAAPAMISASANAARLQDQNRLKQQLLAMHNYHDTYRSFPLRASVTDAGKPLLSWRVQILPFIEQQALYEQFHLDEPWDSEHNKKLIDKMPDVFRSKGDAPGVTTTRFQVFVGNGALLDGEEAVGFANVTDGSSNTIAVVQTAKAKAVPWTKPDDFTLDDMKPLEGLVDAEAEGFHAAFADGSVQWIPAAVDAATLKALITRGGGEVVRIDFGR